MTAIIIASIRLYLKGLAWLAPKAASRRAYEIFSTTRRRRTVPEAAVAIMERAERSHIEARGHRVAVYRWRSTGVDDASSDRPRVMLVHGWESRAARLAVWVEPLMAVGFDVLAFDAPAHGESAGKRTDPGVMTEVICKIRDREGPITAFVGHSLGGLASVVAVAGADFLDREPVAAERLVVLAGAESGVDAMSMFCDVLGLGQAFLPHVLEGAAAEAGRPVADFDVHKLLAKRPIPTLWLHDPQDDVVPFEACQRVVRSCPHVTLEVKEGLGHHRIARDPGVIEQGVAFLRAG